MSEATDAKTKPVVRVDVVSDVMCPWCYIGLRNLQAAVDGVGDEMDVIVNWLPFQLDPTLPKAGKDRQQYLNEKFGGEERAAGIYARIEQAGRAVGLDMDFGAIAVSPNTFDAHRLIALAGRAGPAIQNELVEKLFAAFFTQGVNVGDNSKLTEIAAAVGMNPELVASFLESDELGGDVAQMLSSVQNAGITGVPFFIVDQKAGLPGAQPPDVLAEQLRRAAG